MIDATILLEAARRIERHAQTSVAPAVCPYCHLNPQGEVLHAVASMRAIAGHAAKVTNAADYAGIYVAVGERAGPGAWAPAEHLAKANRTIAALTAALEAINTAVIDGRVCDDVAWFDKFTTLHDFIEEVLRPSQPAVVADLFAEAGA